MGIAEELDRLKKTIPPGVRLIAVSKTQEPERIMQAYNCGQSDFGENKVQELLGKYDKLPSDIRWHMIGHLQSNKVKYIAPFIHTIHSVDSLKLLGIINKEAAKNNRKIRCLLQMHIASEESKFGMNPDELLELLHSDAFAGMHNVKICGLMGMATFTDDLSTVREEFQLLKQYFDDTKADFFSEDDDFCELSMGMSDDYLVGIEEGSTMVRIGSAIFGHRTYPQ